jgi:hypothetical protein
VCETVVLLDCYNQLVSLYAVIFFAGIRVDDDDEVWPAAAGIASRRS